MTTGHRAQVECVLLEARQAHAALVDRVPPELRRSLPVDAQGITRAIDHLATAAGFSDDERRALLRPHATNAAVMHARVFGAAPLSEATVIASFVEGAGVRAVALTALADAIGGDALTTEVRNVLTEHPPPAGGEGPAAIAELREVYAAQEQAALQIAAALDRQR